MTEYLGWIVSAVLLVLLVLAAVLAFVWSRRRMAKFATATAVLAAGPAAAGAGAPDQQFALLKVYHDEGLAQAKISFWFSIGFACLGFGVIVTSLFIDSWRDPASLLRYDLDAQKDRITKAGSKVAALELEVRGLQAARDKDDLAAPGYRAELDQAMAEANQATGRSGLAQVRAAELEKPYLIEQSKAVAMVEEVVKDARQRMGEPNLTIPEADRLVEICKQTVLEEFSRVGRGLRAAGKDVPGGPFGLRSESPPAEPKGAADPDAREFAALLTEVLAIGRPADDLSAQPPRVDPKDPPRPFGGGDKLRRLSAVGRLGNLHTRALAVETRTGVEMDKRRPLLEAEAERAAHQAEQAGLAVAKVEAAFKTSVDTVAAGSRKLADRQSETEQARAELRAAEAAMTDLGERVRAAIAATSKSSSLAGSAAVIGIIAGAVINAVAGLFFVQSNRARKLMSEFFDRLRADRSAEAALGVVRGIADLPLRGRLEAVLAMGLAQITGPEKFLGVVFTGLPPVSAPEPEPLSPKKPPE